MKKSLILWVIGTIFYASTSIAATLTYTGGDLYNDPNVSFPTTQPTLDNDSLVFGPSPTSPINKLLVLPLFSEGQLSDTSPTTVSIHMNLTRLPCDTNVTGGCADNSIEDFDLHIALGDGSNLVGGTAGDGAYDGYDGQGSASVLSDLGDTADFPPTLSQMIFTDSGYPDIYSSFDVNIIITLYTTTTVELSFLDGAGTAYDLLGLDRSAAIDFVFLNEGDPGEQYQINSLAISSPALVPIPPALWLFGSGLLGLVGIARRRKTNRNTQPTPPAEHQARHSRIPLKPHR